MHPTTTGQTRQQRSRCRAVRFDMGDMAASTRVSALVCSPTRACACVHRLDRKTYGLSPQVRESGQEK
jgi:23S rRNA-/tRNA-specific pseudouridylate synthase